MKDSSLTGVFPSTVSPLSTSIATMNKISCSIGGTSKGKEIVETPSVGTHKALYNAIQYASDAYVNDQHLVASYPYHMHYWIDSPLLNLDYLSWYFPSDESIMVIMSLDECLWEDHNHGYSFPPNENLVDFYFVSLIN